MAVVKLSTSNSVTAGSAAAVATITIAAQTGSRVALYGAVYSPSVAPTVQPEFVISAATAQLFKAYTPMVSGPQRFEFVNFVAETSQAVTLRVSSAGCAAVLNAWWGYV